MKLSEFLDRNNHTPSDLEEVAFEAKKVSDDPVLKKAAIAYLRSKTELDAALESVGFEFG